MVLQVIVPGMFRCVQIDFTSPSCSRDDRCRPDLESEILNWIVTWNDSQSGSTTATVTVKRQVRRRSEMEDHHNVDFTTDSSVSELEKRDVL